MEIIIIQSREGSKIAYIKTFNFTREDYKDFLKQYKEENWDWREYKKIK